jgi:hypothetical protein
VEGSAISVYPIELVYIQLLKTLRLLSNPIIIYQAGTMADIGSLLNNIPPVTRFILVGTGVITLYVTDKARRLSS